MSLQSIIQQIKTANLPGENTALRVGSALEQMDAAKRDIIDSLSKEETIDMINSVKLLAVSGVKFLGEIEPATVIPAGDFWAFAGEGTYPNAGGLVVDPGNLAVVSRVGAAYGKVEIKIPKDDSFAITKPEWFNFVEGAGDMWSVNLIEGAVYFGNSVTKKGSVAGVLALAIDFNFIYANTITGVISANLDIVSSPDMIFLGVVHPEIDLFSMRIPFAVKGKAGNITIPESLKESFIITKPEWFNFVLDGAVWKLNIIAGSVRSGLAGSNGENNIANQNLILDTVNEVYHFIYIDLDTNLFEILYTSVDTQSKILIAVVAPQFDLFYVRCPYAVNGKAYNVSTGSAGDNFDLVADTPLLTNTIMFKNDEETAFYRDSIFKSLNGGFKANVVLETTVNGMFKRYDIQNPTFLKASQIGTNIKYVVEGKGFVKKIWKEVSKVYKGLSANLPASILGMCIGDSLYQGNASTNVAPIAILKDRFATYGKTLQTVGTFNQDDGRGFRSDIISEGRGFWSYKSFTGKDNLPYGQPISIATGTGLTGKFQNPFLRLANATDKANHPTWCFTNQVQNAADPDGVSYATNNTYTNYYIFDFANYMSVRGLQTPDFIMMSLGINDWQESAINISDEFTCFTIMYQQIRAALPTVPIIITPTNGIMPANQEAWETEMFPLAERIVKALETYQATDTELHICPIYSHISRQNAGCVDQDITDLSANNNMKTSTTWDVHVLDKESSKLEYMQVLESLVISVLN